MTLLKLTLIALFSTTLYAEQGSNNTQQSVQIDMHGGKEVKMPSHMTTKTSGIFYGKVLEIKDAMGYKYLKVNEDGKELWVAIANAPVAVGDKIGYDKNAIMHDFESKTLNQKFKEIIFASDVYLPQKVQKPQSMKEMLGLSTTAPKEEKPAKPFVKKETYTIEEVHMWRKSLEGQTITLDATVYKVSHQIMKLDWTHLGDGTGDEKKLTDDLIFTSASTTIKSGDKVTATGKVIVNKDFGFGYFYKVLIQDATFKVK